MKKQIVLSLMALICLCSTPTMGQEYKTIQENGKTYILYTPQKGEGLYALSRKFGVSIDDIIALNPEAKLGLKKGQILKIRSTKENNPSEVAGPTESSAKTHKIQPKETLYSVAKTYGLTTQELISLNPGLSAATFSIDKEIIVAQAKGNKPQPKKETIPATKLTPAMLRHQVEAHETFFSISRKYGVSIEEIMSANPGVETLSIGQELLIPKSKAASESATPAAPQPTPNEESSAPAPRPQKGKSAKMALLLPFNIGSTQSQELENQKRFTDYYRGVLLAVDSLKRSGYSTELMVIDTRNTTAVIDSLIQVRTLEYYDFVVGPLFPDQVKRISPYLSKRGIPMVIPFSSRVEITSESPNTFLINTPSSATTAQAASLFINELPENAHIVFLTNSKKRGDKQEMTNELKKALTAKHIPFTNYAYREEELASIQSALREDRQNIIVTETSDTKEMNKVLPVLQTFNSLKETYPMSVWGYNEWQTYFSDFSEAFYALDTHIFASFYADVTSPSYKSFYNNFLKYYHTTMLDTYPRYGLLGFDTALFFIEQYGNGEGNPLSRIAKADQVGIQSGFDFQKSGKSPLWNNKHLFIVEFNKNYDIIRKP